MELVGFLFYVLICGALAWLLARVLTRRAREPWVRWVVAGILAPIVFFLPLADEIVGYFQFERLCEEAKEAKIYGTIPVGEELYTSEGKWRLGMRGDVDDPRGFVENARRLQDIVEGYLRQENRRLPEIHAAIEIRPHEIKIHDAKNGRLLAEYRTYGTSGGRFSQWLSLEGSLIVRRGCWPESVEQIEQTLLKFTKPSEATK